jgi:hypothetical protein
MARMACRVALFATVLLCAAAGVALGAKRAPIPDDLRDVIDEEEDDEWRQYRVPSSRGPGRGDGPPPDLSRMDPAALQAELLRGQTGPSFGFVKLRPGTTRSRVRIPRPRPRPRSPPLPRARFTVSLKIPVFFYKKKNSGACGGDREEVEQCAADGIGGRQIHGG